MTAVEVLCALMSSHVTVVSLRPPLQEPLSLLSHTVESGRGKCPFSPTQPFTARLTGGNQEMRPYGWITISVPSPR